jgi:hypothetical protein
MTGKIFSFAVVLIALAAYACSQEPVLKAPGTVSSGQSVKIGTQGHGSATFYLVGPNRVVKRKISLGEEIEIEAEDLKTAGQYEAIACNDGNCGNTKFNVMPSQASQLIFFLHPSRVPVSSGNAVNATALVLDREKNIVLSPAKVNFKIDLPDGASSTRAVPATRGIASFAMDSRSRQGKVQVTASIDDVSEPRVIQQVAAEACALRMTASPAGKFMTFQTDPIRDCGGNPLPDGTIVSFTKTDSTGRSTVDSPIKKDRAVARFEVTGPAKVSVACGVVVGNELSLGEAQ